jgi:MFS family permease
MATAVSHQQKAIVACILGSLLLRLGNSATGVLISLVLGSLNRSGTGVRPITLGLLAVSFYAAELVGAPIFGALSDRFGRRPFLIAGPIFGGIAIQLIGWPASFVVWPMILVPMTIGRMIEGLSTATSAPSTLSYLTRETDDSPTVRAQVMAWYEVATIVGIGGGFVAAGFMWDRLGYGAFIAVTGIYIASLLLFWQVYDRAPRVGLPGLPPSTAPPPEPRPHIAILALFRRPKVLRFIPAWLAVNAIIGVWFTHAAFQLTGSRHTGQYLAGTFSGSDLGRAFVLFGVAFVVGVWVWGFVMGPRSRTRVMLITVCGIYLVCGAVFALNHIPPTAGRPMWPWLGMFLIGVAVVSGFTPAALAYLADISEETIRQRGAVMGLYSVALGLGQMIGGTLGAPFAAASGIDGLNLLTGLLGTVAFVTVIVLRRFDKRDARVAEAAPAENQPGSSPPAAADRPSGFVARPTERTYRAEPGEPGSL